MNNKKEKKNISKNGNEQSLKNILFTIAYYNALDFYPDTFFVWKHLIDVKRRGQSIAFSEVLRGLEELKEKQKIISKNGFWKLNIVDQNETKRDWYKHQIQKNKISIKKINNAKKWGQVLQHLPYLKGILLTGTLALKRAEENSDWDVLVIIKKNRIWLGRLVLTFWLHFIGKRRHHQKTKNRFCLNQFAVEDRLAFQERNEFSANEILNGRWLIAGVDLKNRFLKSNIDWLKKYKPNYKLRRIGNAQRRESLIGKFSEYFLEKFCFGEKLNQVFKKVMIKKITNNPKTYFKDADIRYGDFFLVFLPHPQRDHVKRGAYELLTKLH